MLCSGGTKLVVASVSEAIHESVGALRFLGKPSKNSGKPSKGNRKRGKGIRKGIKGKPFRELGLFNGLRRSGAKPRFLPAPLLEAARSATGPLYPCLLIIARKSRSRSPAACPTAPLEPPAMTRESNLHLGRTTSVIREREPKQSMRASGPCVPSDCFVAIARRRRAFFRTPYSPSKTGVLPNAL